MDKVQAEKYLAKQEKNLVFVAERIRIQNEANYNPNKLLSVGTRQINKRKSETEYISIRERQYYDFDIRVIEENIQLAKNYINKLT